MSEFVKRVLGGLLFCAAFWPSSTIGVPVEAVAEMAADALPAPSSDAVYLRHIAPGDVPLVVDEHWFAALPMAAHSERLFYPQPGRRATARLEPIGVALFVGLMFAVYVLWSQLISGSGRGSLDRVATVPATL